MTQSETQERLKQEDAWLDVETSQPEARQEVLFVAEFGGEPMVCFGCKAYPGEDRKWYDLGNTDGYGDPNEVYGVTRWMPLPEPPASTTTSERENQ